MKVLTKLLLCLFVFIFGFVSFSEASQFFAYNKQMSKNTNIPDFTISGTTFYTDIVDIDKSNFTGKVRFLIQSNYNCSPGTIYVKDNSLNSRSYLRYTMEYVNYGSLCVSPEINLASLSSLKFFYGTTQNISNAIYVQFVIVDSDSFNLSIKPLSTGFSASVSIPTDCPTCSYSGYILENDVTENYCTNKYSNLIPTENITAGYCESEFGLISPSDCPSGTGGFTGDIMRSSFRVNDRQIMGGSNIFLYIPDWLDWSYTYIDQNLQIDVVNEGDEEYIEDILTVQSYHPSSEDFTVSFVGFLTLVLPYVIVALFCLFVFKLIKRIFK